MLKFSKKHFGIIFEHLVDYPTPLNISYLWSFGPLAGFCLLLQIITGIILIMHYVPHTTLAFNMIEHIMRDVQFGWAFRYAHANGASLFFIIIYLHMARGLYFCSYMIPRERVWISGVIISLLLILTGFIGYVLPWGQMSFWGATVITNLASAIPLIGEYIVYWLWGGFSVDNATLNRFLSLHYLLPFILAVLALIHIIILHEVGSNDPLGVENYQDSAKIPFYPYFYVKDLLSLLFLMLLFYYYVNFFPNTLGHSDNYIEANPMVTPAHIVPEWYFLPFYAILRSIPDKLGGVIAMVSAILILILLPYLNPSKTYYIKSNFFKKFNQAFFWIFIFNFILSGHIGASPVEIPYIAYGQYCTIFYFIYLLIILPLLQQLDILLIIYDVGYGVEKNYESYIPMNYLIPWLQVSIFDSYKKFVNTTTA